MWRRVVLIVAAAGALLLAFAFWQRGASKAVHFVNGLSFPVAVTMGDHTTTVEPGGRTSHEFAPGAYRIVARGTEAGERTDPIEQLDVTVPGHADLVAYNVLGACPLYRQVVAFADDDVPDAELDAKESLTSLAGPSWVTHEDADYLFVEPPDRIDKNLMDRITTRSRVDIWGAGTWVEATGHLFSEERTGEAAAIARRVALLDPSDHATLDRAYQFTVAAGDEAAARTFLVAVIEAAPDHVQPHRMFQTHMEEQGALDEILPNYRAAHEADPTSPHAGYLYARIAPHAEALPIYDALLRSHPDDPWLLRGASWAYLQRGRYTQAAALLERYLEARPNDAVRFVPRLARALAGAGRVHDALETVDALLSVDGLGRGDVNTLMTLYATLRKLLPDDPAFPSVAERWKRLLGGEEPEPGLVAETAALGRDAALVASLRGRIDDEESLRFCDIVLLSRDDVGRAAELALGAAPRTLEGLDDAARIAVACELERAGHDERAAVVLKSLYPQNAGYVSMEDVRGLPATDGLPEDLDIGLRGALLYAASRRVDDDAEKARLVSEARRLDVLRQVVPE